MALDEQRTLDAVRDGDEAAFREVYRLYTPRLLASVSRLLGPRRAEAEDVVQETWLRAVRGLRTFRGESSFSTWLIGIGIRCALEALRRDRPQTHDDEPSSASATPDAAIDLERGLRALADGYRAVLLLHDVEGCTHAEIASLLGIEPGTSKSQLFHARRALRERLMAIR